MEHLDHSLSFIILNRNYKVVDLIKTTNFLYIFLFNIAPLKFYIVFYHLHASKKIVQNFKVIDLTERQFLYKKFIYLMSY
jgi:hypothetical protein